MSTGGDPRADASGEGVRVNAVLSAAKEGHDRDYEMVVLEDCCCALTEEQHHAVIEQMQRIAVMTTSKDVQFG